MLRIRPIMNSAVEEIFAFKVCCGPKAFDQNLEILITNEGQEAVEVHSRFDLRSGTEVHRFDTLMPHGLQRIEPGQVIAFYCNMDEVLWERSEELIFYDRDGNAHRAIIP